MQSRRLAWPFMQARWCRYAKYIFPNWHLNIAGASASNYCTLYDNRLCGSNVRAEWWVYND